MSTPTTLPPTESAETPAAAPQRNRVMDNTLCLALSINRLGVRRKASLSAVTVAADKALLGLSKKLLQSPNLARINLVVSHVRQYLRETALPSFFKAGVYLVPDMMVQEIEARMIIFKSDFDAAVAAFVAEYAGDPTTDPPIAPLPEQMADGLGVLYNPQDYPSVGQVQAAFDMSWRFVGFDVPGRLRQISAAAYERETAKAAREIAEATDEIKAALRAAMAGMVDDMVEKLAPTEDGKRRRLSTSSVEKLQTFLATFDMRNVASDDELSNLVERAREVMKGVDAEALRGDDEFRARIASSFQAIQAEMQTLTVGRHARTFAVEDGDE